MRNYTQCHEIQWVVIIDILNLIYLTYYFKRNKIDTKFDIQFFNFFSFRTGFRPTNGG